MQIGNINNCFGGPRKDLIPHLFVIQVFRKVQERLKGIGYLVQTWKCISFAIIHAHASNIPVQICIRFVPVANYDCENYSCV